MHLVFGHDAIINLMFNTNRHLIIQHKQNLINQRNAKENRKRINHTYKNGDLVLVKDDQSTKYDRETYNGP